MPVVSGGDSIVVSDTLDHPLQWGPRRQRWRGFPQPGTSADCRKAVVRKAGAARDSEEKPGADGNTGRWRAAAKAQTANGTPRCVCGARPCVVSQSFTSQSPRTPFFFFFSSQGRKPSVDGRIRSASAAAQGRSPLALPANPPQPVSPELLAANPEPDTPADRFALSITLSMKRAPRFLLCAAHVLCAPLPPPSHSVTIHPRPLFLIITPSSTDVAEDSLSSLDMDS